MNLFHHGFPGIVIAALVLFSACKDNTASPEVFVPDEPYEWPVSTPQAQGLDSTLIGGAVAQVRGGVFPYVRGFLVVRNGYLVAEHYNSVYGKYSDGDVASVTKSITSALVGIALRERILDSLGQRMLSFFPDFVTPALDPLKQTITIEHLLTMRSGFDFDESQDYSGIYNNNTNWLRVTIELPLRDTPGAVFNYTTPNSHLISGILARASGLNTREFATRDLFVPLGITAGIWVQDPQGYYLGGSGMSFYPRDLARFGYLYIMHGRPDSVQILPADWVQISTQPHDNISRTWGEFTDVKYGYHWWTGIHNTDSLFMAVGFGGQFVVVVPARNIVIVVTSDKNCTLAESGARQDALIHLMATQVLAATSQ